MTGDVAHEGLSEDLAGRWSISSAFLLADTPSGFVYRVTLDNSSSAILKSLKPNGMGELPGMRFLNWRNGKGAVRLLAQEGTVCLLEDAGDVTLSIHRRLHGELAANLTIVNVLSELHSSAAAPPQQLTPLDQHFRALIDRAEVKADPRLREPLSFCSHMAESWLAQQSNIKPLHGDLHHDNIISGGARGWLAIDPKGLLGDPAYDVANIFGNPIGATKDILDPQRIEALCETFAPIIQCSTDRILQAAIIHAGLSVCWSLEDGATLEDGGNACERLAFIKVARSLL